MQRHRQLLDALLEKDPRRRLQNPSRLLELMPNIVGALNAGLSIDSRNLQELTERPATPRRKGTENLTAYDLYLRGMALMELLDPDANQKASELFKRAIEQEPDFALAYNGLAYFYLEQEGFRGEKRLLDSAVECARRAIALDPMDVRSYTTLARAYYRKGWYSQCDEALQKALELGPDDDTANALAGIRAIAKHQFVAPLPVNRIGGGEQSHALPHRLCLLTEPDLLQRLGDLWRDIARGVEEGLLKAAIVDFPPEQAEIHQLLISPGKC